MRRDGMLASHRRTEIVQIQIIAAVLFAFLQFIAEELA
jgi:hypothetical protein